MMTKIDTSDLLLFACIFAVAGIGAWTLSMPARPAAADVPVEISVLQGGDPVDPPGVTELASAAEPPAPPQEAPAPACGSAETRTAVRGLYSDCLKREGKGGGNCKGYALDVELAPIIAASHELPYWYEGFATASAELPPEAIERLSAFLGLATAGGTPFIVMVFGSASPTARVEGFDVALADRRTHAIRLAAEQALYQLGRMDTVAVKGTNIGDKKLDADYCDNLPSDTDGFALCKKLDPIKRRQAAFVLVVPAACVSG